MTRQQKLAPVLVFVVLLGAIGYTLLPFKFANVLQCEPALFGGDPKSEKQIGVGLIRPQEDCHNKAKSRMSVAAVTCLVAVLAGAAVVGSRPLSQACLAGNHDDCREWWTQALGPLGDSFGCQCDCHAGGPY